MCVSVCVCWGCLVDSVPDSGHGHSSVFLRIWDTPVPVSVGHPICVFSRPSLRSSYIPHIVLLPVGTAGAEQMEILTLALIL